MISLGEGSDWNFETDGYPECICDIEGEHHHSVEELWARGEFYKEYSEQRSPATGEAPVVGIYGALVLMLVCVITLARKMI